MGDDDCYNTFTKIRMWQANEKFLESIFQISRETGVPPEKVCFEVTEAAAVTIDWNYDRDRSRILTSHLSEKITGSRRFAIGLLKNKGSKNTLATMIKKLMWNPDAVFDHLKITHNLMPQFNKITVA